MPLLPQRMACEIVHSDELVLAGKNAYLKKMSGYMAMEFKGKVAVAGPDEPAVPNRFSGGHDEASSVRVATSKRTSSSRNSCRARTTWLPPRDPGVKSGPQGGGR